MIRRLRAVLPGATGLGVYAAASLWGASVALAFADQWPLAVALLIPVGWLAGRYDRGQRVAVLVAERDQARGEAFALSEERRFVWNQHLDARSGDRLMPDNGGGYRTAAAVLDRKSDTATATSGVQAPERAVPLP